MSDVQLPAFPEPAFEWVDDYYTGWEPLNGKPECRYWKLDIFSTEQMQAYGLACYQAGVEAERERCAAKLDEMHDRQIDSMSSHNYYRHAAAAIRKGNQ